MAEVFWRQSGRSGIGRWCSEGPQGMVRGQDRGLRVLEMYLKSGGVPAVLSGIMISMGRILEKPGPKRYVTRVRGKNKRNSAKFKVANGSSTHRQALDDRPCCSPSAPKRSDLVLFVAPLCIKGLRLVTAQLPKKLRPSDRGSINFRFYVFCEFGDRAFSEAHCLSSDARPPTAGAASSPRCCVFWGP
jgi:hypothetical protein